MARLLTIQNGSWCARDTAHLCASWLDKYVTDRYSGGMSSIPNTIAVRVADPDGVSRALRLTTKPHWWVGTPDRMMPVDRLPTGAVVVNGSVIIDPELRCGRWAPPRRSVWYRAWATDAARTARYIRKQHSAIMSAWGPVLATGSVMRAAKRGTPKNILRQWSWVGRTITHPTPRLP